MIDSLVIKYRETGNEVVLSRIYEQIHRGGVLVSKFSRKYGLDNLDVESMINDKLLSLLESHDRTKGKFTTALFTAIEFGCIDLFRRKTAEEEFLEDVMFEDEDGEQTEVYEVTEVAPTTSGLESHITNTIRSDQRQLIASLLEKADEPTKLTITAFLQSDSFREAAKQLGVCHKTVAARIRRISRNFDPEKSGNHYDYFLVPTA